MSKTTNLLHFLAKYDSLWNIKTNSLSHMFPQSSDQCRKVRKRTHFQLYHGENKLQPTRWRWQLCTRKDD